jgi:hypothetical protein
MGYSARDKHELASKRGKKQTDTTNLQVAERGGGGAQGPSAEPAKPRKIGKGGRRNVRDTREVNLGVSRSGVAAGEDWAPPCFDSERKERKVVKSELYF